jgi:hypothetical protein
VKNQLPALCPSPPHLSTKLYISSSIPCSSPSPISFYLPPPRCPPCRHPRACATAWNLMSMLQPDEVPIRSGMYRGGRAGRGKAGDQGGSSSGRVGAAKSDESLLPPAAQRGDLAGGAYGKSRKCWGPTAAKERLIGAPTATSEQQESRRGVEAWGMVAPATCGCCSSSQARRSIRRKGNRRFVQDSFNPCHKGAF